MLRADELTVRVGSATLLAGVTVALVPGEVLAVVGLFNQMNKLADAYQIEPDILPLAARTAAAKAT